MEQPKQPDSIEGQEAKAARNVDRRSRTARGCGVRLLVALVLLVVCVAIIKDLNIGYTFRNTAFVAENRPVVEAILASMEAAYPKFVIDDDSLEGKAIPELSRIMGESFESTDVRGVHYSEHARLFIKGQRGVFLGFNCSEYPNGVCVQVSVYFRIKDDDIEIISAHTGMHEWAARSWHPDTPYRIPISKGTNAE